MIAEASGFWRPDSGRLFHDGLVLRG